jgi:hypothetical protein
VRLTLLVLACVACNRGPKQPHATGRLVFDVRPANEATVFLATEAEVLRSAPMLRAIREQWPGHELDPEALSVTRHADTMILDITVTDRDPHVAAESCNRVLQAYVDRRRSMAVFELQNRMKVLDEKLQASPDNADLKRQLDELDTQARIAKTDVRVLEPCLQPRQ